MKHIMLQNNQAFVAVESAELIPTGRHNNYARFLLHDHRSSQNTTTSSSSTSECSTTYTSSSMRRILLSRGKLVW